MKSCTCVSAKCASRSCRRIRLRLIARRCRRRSIGMGRVAFQASCLAEAVGRAERAFNLPISSTAAGQGVRQCRARSRGYPSPRLARWAAGYAAVEVRRPFSPDSNPDISHCRASSPAPFGGGTHSPATRGYSLSLDPRLLFNQPCRAKNSVSPFLLSVKYAG